MLTKSDKLWIKSLQNKKLRWFHRMFVAEGSKVVVDLLTAKNMRLHMICGTKDWLNENSSILPLDVDKVIQIGDSFLKDLSALKTSDHVVAVFNFPDFTVKSHDENCPVFYFERIRDPGNLGTIIRTADWFGINKLYCSHDCVDQFNNKCIQATMASISKVEIIHKDWNEMLEMFPSRKKFAAVMDGLSYSDYNGIELEFVCIGNESQGLSAGIVQDCEHKIAIPSSFSLGAQSLNAAIASAILMSRCKVG